MTVLASGSIEIAGDTRLRHAHPDGLLLVAAGDLRLAGAPHADQIFEGILAAREQIRISGSPEILGCVVAQDACDKHRLNGENAVVGSPTFISVCGPRTCFPLLDPAFPWFKLDARIISVAKR